MTAIAPVANFEGTVNRLGYILGGREDPETGDPIYFNDSLLNVQINDDGDYFETGPLLVGMGNALKIYITYIIEEGETDPGFEAWINLCWMQRVQGKNRFVIDLPSRGAEEAIRSFSNAENEFSAVNSCNRGIFYDVSATKVVSGDLDDLEMRYQRIKLPFSDPPFPESVLNLPTYKSGSYARGVVYECIAKSDELYAVLTTNPEDVQGTSSDLVSVDVCIGSNAQGEQK